MAAISTAGAAADIQMVLSFVDLIDRFDGIQGFLDPREGFALMALAAKGEGFGQIVEIGSFMGLSTCWLATGAKAAGREKVHAVDHFKGSPEHQEGGTHPIDAVIKEGTTLPAFKRNLEKAGVADWVVPIVASSEEAAAKWQGPIRLLFIDGDHDYEPSKRDFEMWSKFVTVRGCVAFHDIGPWEGVTRFYNELLATNKNWKEVASSVYVRVVQRVK